MLYKRTKTDEKLDQALFENPSSEYRGAPFWAWNAVLDEAELKEQIDIFREMGFGGFHMHVRQGLETPYLSNEFFRAVKSCVRKAGKEKMLAWLYDEDRWPSGYGGGVVTKNKRYRQKYLLVTKQDRETASSREEALESGKDFFLAAFDVSINKDGEMTSYRRIGRDEKTAGKWYFFVCIRQGGEAAFNGQSYVDTLSKEAIDEFRRVTYVAYRDAVGEEFGSSVPAIFSDEPNIFFPEPLPNGFSRQDARLGWTMDFDVTYKEEYGEDILEQLPELVFAMAQEGGMVVRYQYYRHLSERFAKAYADNLGNWCEENNLMFTGHMMGEDSLYTASSWMGDVMRMYKQMQLPGIDMLYDNRAFVTAKQCQSVVRQYGREGMLSELYGVTGWDFDFRGHKLQGDWQACLGVTVRVPHLAWQTMCGEGKRDYPASIFYQSPWYREYKRMEDHFARLNTAMTRGKACVRTAVLHPVESYWLLRGSAAETQPARDEMDTHFREMAEWLLGDSIDFDYLAESLLEELCTQPSNPLIVGEMKYDIVIVADCITLRPYTIKVLEEYRKKGGRLLFVGRTPYLSLGKPSKAAEQLAASGERIMHSRAALLGSLKKQHDVFIRKSDGSAAVQFLYQLRQDGEDRWLFIANGVKPELAHISKEQNLCITVEGNYRPLKYDTLTGEIRKVTYKNENDTTQIYVTMYDHDSLLLKLEKSCRPAEEAAEVTEPYLQEIPAPFGTEYELEEPNVLVLDVAQYGVDDGKLHEAEEILRIDEAVRKELGLESRKNKRVQPWVVSDALEDHTLRLVFTIDSQITCTVPMLAMENPDKARIVWNGEDVVKKVCGWYVDKHIPKLILPCMKKGINTLQITIPFGLRTDLENCYLLGEFGVSCVGRKTCITQLPGKLYYGSVTNQGMAFYGGNIRYHSEMVLERDSDVEIEISHYRGALIKVLVDGEEKGCIIYAPYRLRIPDMKKGAHRVTYILYGNRYNTFSALHTLVADRRGIRIGPDFWRSEGQEWSYEYQTRAMGILKTPVWRIKESGIHRHRHIPF